MLLSRVIVFAVYRDTNARPHTDDEPDENYHVNNNQPDNLPGYVFIHSEGQIIKPSEWIVTLLLIIQVLC